MMDSVENLKHLGDCFIPVRWTDLDAYSHVNNAKYFEYLTEGRAIVFRELILEPENFLIFLVYTQCSFLKQIEFPNTLKLKHYLKETGRTSFVILVDLFSEDETIHFARTECKLVCVDSVTQRPIRLPEQLNNLLI